MSRRHKWALHFLLELKVGSLKAARFLNTCAYILYRCDPDVRRRQGLLGQGQNSLRIVLRGSRIPPPSTNKPKFSECGINHELIAVIAVTRNG